METLFYFANRFRYCALTEALKGNSNQGTHRYIVGMLNSMFNMDGSLEQTKWWKVRSFFKKSYRHYFRSTMWYSSISLFSRTILYDQLILQNKIEEDYNFVKEAAASIAIGVFT